ncbi:hypothetical protein RFI_24306 [Reticulomyxa filosa]|uniref:Uncharacterized protein n=1 Tax=Reticulomyxa filosa TaxID=46433 RepID=X6MGQ3_RETFI|nr:hypothetical protein RFI_24306 [Reticulomyxa filosa]|eukprot:ETO13069.1 hypothetical protein RFI_24306 [Reticulomyxa filosa]
MLRPKRRIDAEEVIAHSCFAEIETCFPNSQQFESVFSSVLCNLFKIIQMFLLKISSAEQKITEFQVPNCILKNPNYKTNVWYSARTAANKENIGSYGPKKKQLQYINSKHSAGDIDMKPEMKEYTMHSQKEVLEDLGRICLKRSLLKVTEKRTNEAKESKAGNAMDNNNKKDSNNSVESIEEEEELDFWNEWQLLRQILNNFEQQLGQLCSDVHKSVIISGQQKDGLIYQKCFLDQI